MKNRLLWQLLYWIIFIHPAEEGMSDHGTYKARLPYAFSLQALFGSKVLHI